MPYRGLFTVQRLGSAALSAPCCVYSCYQLPWKQRLLFQRSCDEKTKNNKFEVISVIILPFHNKKNQVTLLAKLSYHLEMVEGDYFYLFRSQTSSFLSSELNIKPLQDYKLWELFTGFGYYLNYQNYLNNVTWVLLPWEGSIQGAYIYCSSTTDIHQRSYAILIPGGGSN